MLPKGFVRIRHFGFLANRFRVSRLALGRQLLASSSLTEQEARTHDVHSESSSLWHCPRCGASGPAYFREAAEVIAAAAGGPPDRARMMDVFRRHGMTLAAPPPIK